MKVPSKEMMEALKAKYPVGTRLKLIKMDDKQAPPKGTLGTVVGIDDMGDLLMKWDTGSTLKVILGVDRVKKVEEK